MKGQQRELVAAVGVGGVACDLLEEVAENEMLVVVMGQGPLD